MPRKRRSLPSGRLGALPIPVTDLTFCLPKSRPSFAPALSERERPALGRQTADRFTPLYSRSLSEEDAKRQEKLMPATLFLPTYKADRLGALPIPAADLAFCPPKSRPFDAPALSDLIPQNRLCAAGRGSRSESVLRWAGKRQIDLLSSKTELYMSKKQRPRLPLRSHEKEDGVSRYQAYIHTAPQSAA